MNENCCRLFARTSTADLFAKPWQCFIYQGRRYRGDIGYGKSFSLLSQRWFLHHKRTTFHCPVHTPLTQWEKKNQKYSEMNVRDYNIHNTWAIITSSSKNTHCLSWYSIINYPRAELILSCNHPRQIYYSPYPQYHNSKTFFHTHTFVLKGPQTLQHFSNIYNGKEIMKYVNETKTSRAQEKKQSLSKK